MSLRRVVALLLLVAVSASSVEVLFGLESSLDDAEVDLVVTDAYVDAAPGPSGDAGEDCACLCACLCPGAQLVVAPADEPVSTTRDVAEPFTAEDHRSPAFPSPRPPHRPPLA